MKYILDVDYNKNITSVGIELEDAKEAILEMHGKYRFPTLLKEVDSLCRGNR